MEKEEILKGKISIAKFMGAKEDCYPKGLPSGSEFTGNWENNLEYFNYNTEWSWLMPVVEKIAKNYDVSITWMPNALDVTYISRPDVEEGEISSMGGMTAIENTFLAVTRFIDWYNTKRKTKHL